MGGDGLGIGAVVGLEGDGEKTRSGFLGKIMRMGL